MFINEVIRRCDAYCPNEYSLREKYAWCDDLSAMLTQEHDRRYEAVRVKKDLDNTYLLPEGITYEMIDSILYRGREIKKYDWRSYEIKYLYMPRHQIFIPEGCCGISGDIEVVYIKQHEPIRDTVITGSIEFTKHGFYFYGNGLRAGDSVNIKDADMSFENVPIFEVTATDEAGKYFADTGDSLSGIHLTGESETIPNCTIERIVTEETICSAPYDLMYVDYVMAQVCYYQRDFATYGRHMTNFNQRLAAFDAWLQKRRVQEKDNKIYNWW